jgi:hypothetical protein
MFAGRDFKPSAYAAQILHVLQPLKFPSAVAA